MQIILILLLSFLFSPIAEASYNRVYNYETGVGDFVGVDASSDIAVPCPSGQVMLSSGGGSWACGSAGGSGSVPTGTGFYHINAGNADASARAVNLASSDVTGTLAIGNGGTGLTSISNDAVLVGNNAGSGFDAPVIPNCIDTGGNHLNYTQATGNFSCGTSSSGGGGGGLSYTTSFTNASLTAGVLTVTHSLAQKFNVVSVYDNNDKLVVPDQVTATDTNTVTIDFSSFGTLTGTWNVRVVG